MTLNIDLVLKSEIKILKESSIYPSRHNNAYHVKISNEKTSYEDHFAPKPIIDAAIHLKKLKISKSEMRILIGLINDISDFSYENGSNSNID